MARRLTTTVTAAFAAAVAVGCGDDPNDPDNYSICPDAVAVTVRTSAPGSAPSFDWTPSCRLHMLTVTTAATSPTMMWSAISSGNDLLPGVTYGRLKGDATTPAAPLTLESGVSYRVLLDRVDPGFPSPKNTEIGRATFVAP